jgi:hypothetical protein
MLKSSINVIEVAGIALFAGANILCLLLHANAISDVSSHAADLAMINLIPLYLGGRLNRLTNLSRLNFDSYALTHQCIGSFVIVEALIHSVYCIRTSGPFSIADIAVQSHAST